MQRKKKYADEGKVVEKPGYTRRLGDNSNIMSLMPSLVTGENMLRVIQTHVVLVKYLQMTRSWSGNRARIIRRRSYEVQFDSRSAFEAGLRMLRSSSNWESRKYDVHDIEQRKELLRV